MDRDQARKLMNEVLVQQHKPGVNDESQSLRELGFRSLDFSELALRVEDELDVELNFDADRLRAMNTVADVLNFFAENE